MFSCEDDMKKMCEPEEILTLDTLKLVSKQRFHLLLYFSHA